MTEEEQIAEALRKSKEEEKKKKKLDNAIKDDMI
jgi:hypothetical protein